MNCLLRMSTMLVHKIIIFYLNVLLSVVPLILSMEVKVSQDVYQKDVDKFYS